MPSWLDVDYHAKRSEKPTALAVGGKLHERGCADLGHPFRGKVVDKLKEFQSSQKQGKNFLNKPVITSHNQQEDTFSKKQRAHAMRKPCRTMKNWWAV
jgi:hypothetical protein